MFNLSEEDEVDHTFFDSDSAENSADVGHQAEKGLKPEEEIPRTFSCFAHDLCAKHREDYLSSLTDQNVIHLKQVENNNSSMSSVSSTSDEVRNESSDSEDCSNLRSERPSGTFMTLPPEAKEVNNSDGSNQSPKKTKEETLPFSTSSKRINKRSPNKLMRNWHNQSPSGSPRMSPSPALSSTETSAHADSEGSYSSSSQRSSLESPPPPTPGSSSCPGVRRTRTGSARPQDLPPIHTAESNDTVTDVTPLSSPDSSPLQSLDLNVTEVEEENHKEEQPQKSLPSGGLRNTHLDEDSDQDVEECSLSLESQLGRKLAFHYPAGRNRKNCSFSNDEVRRIDLENQRLLRELTRHSPGPRPGTVKKTCRPGDTPRIRLTHSAVNRQREQQRIERENLAFLKRLESVKPTPGLRRSEQLADYQRQAGYLGGSLYPVSRSATKNDQSSSRTTSGPGQVSPRAAAPSVDPGNRPPPRSRKPGATRPAWC